MLESRTDELAHALGAYMELRKALKTRMLDESVAVVADPDAAEILRKITMGDGLPSDKIIERIFAHTGEDIKIHEFDCEEIEELGSELFYSWFSHYEYVLGLAELRPLILRAAIPESVLPLVRQVRDCYAFQQYDAAYALCRIVIEASVRDICIRRRLFPDLGDNVVLFEEHKWRKLRDKVSSGSLRERLRDLYADLSAVIHSRKSVSKKETREAFEETLQVVELLYAEHRP